MAYGATKRGLPQMTDSLVKELEDCLEDPRTVYTYIFIYTFYIYCIYISIDVNVSGQDV